MVTKQRWSVGDALNVATQVHTSPSMFGKVMSLTEPRLAVGYHFFNDFDTAPFVERQIRTTYDGPLALAVDYMVFNVTKEDIRVRMASINEDVWPLPSVTAKLPADPSQRVGFTKFLIEGREVFQDVINKVYDETNEEFGTDVEAPN
jgi:ribonuclease Z